MIVGKNNLIGYGKTPAIVLINPRFGYNVGSVVRAASCFGLTQVLFTGERLLADLEMRKRLPREERMKGYGEVELIATDYPLDLFSNGAVPVCVELLPNTWPLTTFEHPTNAVYIFGPEDGGVSKAIRVKCHHFVHIPARHCLNLGACVYITLYDRMSKSGELLNLVEDRKAS